MSTTTTTNPPNLRPQITTFFSSPLFILSGASPSPQKFGHKLYTWYLNHTLPCIPLNPRNPPPQIHSAQSQSQDPSTSPTPQYIYQTHTSLSSIPPSIITSIGGWGNISLSIVTPPKVTIETLREARKLGIKRVWMQPGAWDEECVREEEKERGSGGGAFEVFVYGGEGEGEMEVGGGEGWCVLVHGEEGLTAARGEKGERGRGKL